jgi:uncharacterized protein (UPF0218 family)
VAKKKKQKRFSAVGAVKEMARERIGAPPAARVVPNKKKRQTLTEKHRPKLEKLLEET